MVIWIIGLSGVGKTTLAEKVVNCVRERGRQVVLLDGDEIRALFNNDLGHDMESRKENAGRICRLCAMLDKQGIDVICAILSLFAESRNWCRENLSSYFEVFIDSPIELLIKRDSKGLYGRYARGEINEVAGLDLEFRPPSCPEMIIKNTGGLDELIKHASIISEKICEKVSK